MGVSSSDGERGASEDEPPTGHQVSGCGHVEGQFHFTVEEKEEEEEEEEEEDY